MYKKSKYFISFNDEESNNYFFYNFFTETLLVADHQQNEKVAKLLNRPNDFLNDEYFERLYQEGFILSDDYNEMKALKERHIETLENTPVIVSICSTLSCNFSCFYCYQKRNNSSLSKEMADILIKYINSYKGKQIAFNWIGGEPLLNFETIKYIVTKTQVPYSSNLYTNAYLLDNYIDELKILNLEMVYLTIDGLPDMHNSIRFSESDDHTFDKILSNVHKIAEKYPLVKVVIKVNLEKEIKFDLNSFLHLFRKLKDRIFINPGCVIKKDMIDSNNQLIDTNLANFSLQFYHDLLKNGFATYKLPQKKLSGGCPAFNKDSFAISSDGIIHKCIEEIGTNNLILGQIKDKELDLKKDLLRDINNFNIFNNNQCVNCRIFPTCMGGCFESQLMNMNKNNGKCKYFDIKLARIKSMILNFFNNQIN